ncbi:MAG: AtpZ/AtpI family protein [Candidatus Acidiferrales bacterium]
MSSADPKRPDDTGGTIKQMALAFQLPFTLVAPVVLGGAIGYFLDRWLHTKPYLMLVLGILGVVAGVLDALKSASAEDKKNSE